MPNTPRGLALFASVIIAGFTLILFLVFDFNSENIGLKMLVMIPSIFAITFFLVYIILERFVGRRIKLIYKTIRNLKISKERDVAVKMKADVLSEVSKEVEQWARENKKEIEKLKVQEKYRREFVGNVAHELKTPIFNIQGYILTLLEGGLEDPSVNKDYLSKAAKSVDRLINIVKDLDAITGFEAGRLDLEIQKIDIVKLAKDVIDSFEMKANNAGIQLGFRKDYDQPFWVMADKKRIRQVLVNLLDNSIKYGKENGSTEIRFYHMDEHCLIEIADDGIGMAEKHLPRIFERFYRVDKSRSRDNGGTGLGLAIVKHIIDAHNETINVRSTEDIGTTFSFTLKIAN